jgi:gliding motility-associated-like protein
MKNLILLILLSLSANLFATIHADYTVDKGSGCSPLLSNFTSTSTTSIGVISHRWDFGNGSGPVVIANPSAIFNSSGTYRVKLVVTNGVETDSITKSIRVFRLPQVDFTAVRTDICYGDTLVLNSQVTPGNAPITDYAWGFGNGNASSGVTTRYIYPQTGDYDVTLVVQDSNNCTANLTKPLYAHVAARPDAEFTASPQHSCNTSQLINFTNSSTGTGLTYLWRLTGNTTSTAQNPTHTYNQQFQLVTLVVTNSSGCIDSIIKAVSATSLVVDFSASKTQICTGEPLNFNNNSNFVRVSYWNFGDGSTSTDRNPTHIYNAPGSYTVKLVETYGYGSCTDSITKVNYINVVQGFIPNVTSSALPAGCTDTTHVSFTNNTPNIAQLVWSFGDGTTGDQPSHNHGYTSNGNYTVVVLLTDSNGCTVSVSLPVSVNTHKPNTSFAVSGRLVCPNMPIEFRSTSGNVGTYEYLWDFGDGSTSELQNPLYSYSSPGVYTVSLTVTNGAGCDSTLVKTNHITVEDIVSDFTVNQRYSPCPPFVALFTSTSNKPIEKYFWDFGDGTTDTVTNPTHIYFHPGIFTVRLAIKTITGCVDTITYTNLIEVQGPSGVFTITPTDGCLPMQVVVTATVSSNTKIMACDLADGNLVKDSTIFSHTYTQLGTFAPKFILEDYVGCSVPYDLPGVTTHSTPVFQLRDTTVCAGETITVASLGIDKYQWTPASYLSCDTCSSVSIVPAFTTAYAITATNQYGCTTTDTMHVTAEQLPLLADSTFKVCRGAEVELNIGTAHRMAWSPATYLNDTSAIQPVCTALDSITYIATGFNSLGCSVSAQVSVSVIDKLDASANADITVCALDTFQLQASVANAPESGVTYNWTPAAHFINANTDNPTGYGLQTETTFSVIASAQTCEADTALVTVHINPLPTVQISESVTTTPNAEVAMYASSADELNYVWAAADSFSCITCRQTNFYPSQTQTVYVTGTNSFGCHTTDSVLIRVVACDPESVFVPNVFTPNNDGQNDELFFASKALADLDYFRVFDKWGSMIYQAKSLNETWDGLVNGAPAANEVFVFVMEGTCQNGGKVLKYGNVSIVR